jgi:transcriptional regulator GlxA family with amidase domain
MNDRLHFCVVAVDGCLASSVYGPIELVQTCAKLLTGLPELAPCDITTEVLSPDGRPFSSYAGYLQPVDGSLKDLPPRSVILVPGFGVPVVSRLTECLDRHRPLGEWLKRQHLAGHVIAAVSTGNFLLAEHDLLPTRKATGYWLYAEFFRERYPHIELDVDTVVVEDDGVFSISGLACGLDAVLTIVERFVGQEAARLCAKLVGIETRRPSELRYERRQPMVHHDPLVDRAVKWIRGNLHARFTVNDLLREVPTSRRSLSRRFKLETGEAMQAFVQRLRIDRAKLLLETSALPIEQIVDRVGYQDKSAFSRQFKRHTQLTPHQYRQRYSLSGSA